MPPPAWERDEKIRDKSRGWWDAPRTPLPGPGAETSPCLGGRAVSCVPPCLAPMAAPQSGSPGSYPWLGAGAPAPRDEGGEELSGLREGPLRGVRRASRGCRTVARLRWHGERDVAQADRLSGWGSGAHRAVRGHALGSSRGGASRPQPMHDAASVVGGGAALAGRGLGSAGVPALRGLRSLGSPWLAPSFLLSLSLLGRGPSTRP